jgi:two-component system, chemotaxis family, chemotaxis protein CheY
MAKIMIVDDSSLSRRILRRILEPAGHQVIEAEDGIVAIEKYFIEKPDLVFLDLTMDGMHGLDVLAQLRQMDSQVRAVIATADIQSSTRKMAVEAGARGFVNKPFDETIVLDAAQSVLEQTP